MTAFVIGLVVAVFLCVLALVQGVTRTLSVTASTRNVIAMRVGSQAEMQSVITRDQAEQIQALPGPERGAAGKPYVSPELLTLINVPRADGKSSSNVQIRGLAPDRPRGPAGREDRRRPHVQRRRPTRRSSPGTSRSGSPA